MKTQSLSTLLALASSLQTATATFGGFGGGKSFTCPTNSDNDCNPEQKGGFNWNPVPVGPIDSYGGIQFSGWNCANSFGSNSKRDLTKRTFANSKCITGTAHSDKSKAPSFSCGSSSKGSKPFSVDQFHVSVEFDCDLEFHYGMPGGSSCKHISPCKKGGSVVKNSQCGGATAVTVVYPTQTAKSPPPKKSCSIGIHTVSFHCGSSTTPVVRPTTKPGKPSKTPGASTTSVAKPTTTAAASSSKPVVETSPAKETSPAAPTTTPVQMTTSTIFTTSVSTITSCAPTVTNCPAHSTVLTTVTIPVSTTVCPVSSETSPPAVGSSSPPAAGTSAAPSAGTSAPPAGESSAAPSAGSSAPPAGQSSAAPSAGTSAPPAGESSAAPSAGTTAPPAAESSAAPSAGTTAPPAAGSSEVPSGGSPTTSPAPEDVTTTVVVVDTTTVCPFTSTHTTAGTTSIETGITTSTIQVTVTSTVCNKCTGKPKPTKAPVTTAGPSGPVNPAPCPEVLPSCMNTWNFLVGCADNTDHACYCPSAEFVNNVFGCLSSYGASDSEVAQAKSFFQGICAPYIPSNPAIVTGAPTGPAVPTTAGTAAGEAPTAPPAIPQTTMTVVTTIQVPYTITEGESSGSIVPSSSVESVLSTTLTIPQVVFSTVSTEGQTTPVPELVAGTPAAVAAAATNAPVAPKTTIATVAAPTNGTRPTASPTLLTANSGSQTGVAFGSAFAAVLLAVLAL
ncbi:uncharacterized protein BP5553_01572 [Venustampulla echinocandica]|uniref:CFEM domain-containing protein n=1 Tax=Venustampulla echinocandica TaxID=2656787 RepID=A0A370U1H0_9HELO|nr:uncharacterized protein BP5553_01572 [Venustampulla echinocandica]RDL41593.1 hypothetical protein BP5553_01572 [Venustampulla echinocandica]